MNIEISVREINKTDFEYIYSSICDLEDEIFEIEVFEDIFSENIANQNFLYLIAESSAEKLGFITFHTQKLLHHGGLVGEIQEFYISPNHRNKGIGRLLIEKVMDFVALSKLKSIEVTTNKKRVENIAIYENLGFSLTHNKFTICRK